MKKEISRNPSLATFLINEVRYTEKVIFKTIEGQAKDIEKYLEKGNFQLINLYNKFYVIIKKFDSELLTPTHTNKIKLFVEGNQVCQIVGTNGNHLNSITKKINDEISFNIRFDIKTIKEECFELKCFAKQGNANNFDTLLDTIGSAFKNITSNVINDKCVKFYIFGNRDEANYFCEFLRNSRIFYQIQTTDLDLNNYNKYKG